MCDIGDGGQTVEILSCDTVFAQTSAEVMKRVTNKLKLASVCGGHRLHRLHF